MKSTLVLIFSLLLGVESFSQTIVLPIVNVKSHKTLTIEKIEIVENQTVVFLSVENQKTEGEAWFCADKRIYLENARGPGKFFLVKSEGIPVCPDSYKFKKQGEILQFRLFFPAIPQSIKEINIVEDCLDNCFYFKGVILDPVQNAEIKLFEKGVTLFSDKKADEALACFRQLSENMSDRKSSIYGYSLYIIPLILYQKGNRTEAKAEYLKLLNSDIPEKDYFLDKLKQEDFFKDLK